MAGRNNPKDAWLLDAEVRCKIQKVNRRWEVSLIFVDTKDPSHILVRKIGDYRSKRLAEVYARNMQKNAAKDVRGTQKVNRDDYNINNN